MDIRFPEYGNCIANLACSILRYYGAETPNPTLAQADALLSRPYKNVVLLLLDGMGSSTVQEHLQQDGFFRRNMIDSYSSTFPPTTVAATTAVMSGLYPNQSAWLGWVGYFPEADRNVVYYTNKDNDTGEKVEGESVAFASVPYPDIFTPIEAKGIQTYWLTSWREPKPKKFEQLCAEIQRLCLTEDRKFIYAYWEEPDKTMHKKGVLSQPVQQLVREVELSVENLANQLSDTLLLITADHGLIDAYTVMLSHDEEIMNCLVRRPSMEARALNLFVKEECLERFEMLFQQKYGSAYRLYTMKQAREMHLLGTKNDHPKLKGMLGNYLAVATDKMTLRIKDKYFIGEHAGLTADEMTIPLIAVEKQ